MRRHLGRAAGWVLALAGLANVASAQSIGVDVAAGIATPSGGFGALRSSGPLVQIGAVQVNPDRRFRWRAQLEAAWMPASGSTSPLSSWQAGDARVMSALGGFTLGQRGTDGAYVLLAISRHWVDVEARPNPYGSLWGTRIGLGARWRMRGLAARVELAPHTILSDYGTTEYSPAVFWATSAGLTF